MRMKPNVILKRRREARLKKISNPTKEFTIFKIPSKEKINLDIFNIFMGKKYIII